MNMPTVSGAQTIHKAMRIVKLVARQSAHGMRLIDIVRAMDIERPTAHRILKALVSEGVLRQETDHRYRLGALAFELCLTANYIHEMGDICAPILTMLAEQTGDTSFIFVRRGNDALCLAREQGTYHIQTPVVAVGSRQPLGISSGGLAILSAMDEADVGMLLESMAPCLPDYKELDMEKMWAYWRKAKELGYAVIANRAALGVRGVGVAVYSEAGAPFAAVTVATTMERMTDDRVRSIVPLLQEASLSITKALK